LDDEYRDWLAGFLADHRAHGAAICFTSHDPVHSGQIADRLVRLQAGRLVATEDEPSATGRILPYAARA
jgi:ABC-type multidrug transport system ATPase subunit